MDKQNYIHTIFASISKRYDFLNSLLSLTLDKSWREFTVSVSGLKPGCRVLDVCTGTGELALTYAKSLFYKTRVVGTDFCYEMLVICKQKLKMKKIEHALVPLEADTLHLPFKDNSFDIVSAAFGLRNVTDIRRGIREMTRVIVPSGRVVILEFTHPTNPISRGIYYLYFTKILPLIGNAISQNRNDAYGYLPNSVVTFLNKNQLKEMMEECGLRDIEVYRKIFGIVAIHVGRKGARGQEGKETI
ncbi:bifunctional demethylmenaquinone methyltransferase/2-methoxy-6-polyprenyl-1,4-benzoquinol methylase UbiE [Candidatus Poribacteria bacterium]|nr:bifunctional demethylmenaquinone methyltransferase/2-methoxy-6-polyprenyl-1,4-benzoquinol methylase UbiE [Candidatus Poribacteria bacterium]